MNENASTGIVDPSLKQTAQAAGKPKQTSAKKKGLIIGAIAACVVILIGVIVAVVLAKSTNNTNAFEKVQERLFSLDEARNVKFDGYAKLTVSDSSSPVSEVNLSFDGQIPGTLSINNTKVSTEFKLNGGQTVSPEIELVTTATGDLYLKPSGITESFSKLVGYSYDMLPKDNPVVSLIDKIENKWLLISLDDIKEMMDSADKEDTEKAITCLGDYVNGLSQKKYEQMEIVKKYPYIIASQDNITIPQKSNPIYRLTFDKDNLEKAIEELEKTEWAKGPASCVDLEDASDSDIDLDKVLSSMPSEFYVEIDNNYDITRFYISYDINEAGLKMIADINMSYPDTVNIAEPAEYSNFSDAFADFTQAMSSLMEEE